MRDKICLNTGIILLLALFVVDTYGQEKPWKLKTTKEGINIYQRSVAHSRIKELKMTTKVKSNLGAIVHILQDVPAYPEWMYGCRHGEEVYVGSDTMACYKSTLNFPNPFADRVMFLSSTLHQDTLTKTVTLISKSVEDVSFDNNEVVLMKDVVTTWVLKPRPGGEVAIESYLFCDPGGNIPAWLVNRLLDRGPLKSILNLLKRLEMPEFRNLTLAYIQE